jgi:hypothetical protein
MAVLETPWFMKTKTSDLGRINKVFDERFQASVSLIDFKKRKSMLKIDDEIKNIKVEFRHIRTDVDFSTDLDEHGEKIKESEVKQKSMVQHLGKRKGFQFGHGSHSVPPGLEMERQRYLHLIGRNRKREMTMVELWDMCHNCVNKENTDETSKYIQRARLVLFPKQKRVKKDKKNEKRGDSQLKDVNENRHNEKGSPVVERLDLGSILVADRTLIRSKSASSSGRAREGSKIGLTRMKTLNVINRNDLQTSDDRKSPLAL